MNIIKKLLTREEFNGNPPILLDIGASGAIPKIWRKIAKYSICIAFDADKREIEYLGSESGFKKLYIYNSILTNQDTDELDFYLTKSPYCSSTLLPDSEKLLNYSFGDYFIVENKTKLKASKIGAILGELNISKIDWFKTDSQGTDLRLFIDLGEKVLYKVLVADFEPGLIDAYEGEDKLWALLHYMENKPFWISDLKVKGVERMNKEFQTSLFPKKIHKRFIGSGLIIKKSPCWAEISYLNSFSNTELFDKRDFMLAFIFGILKKQFGFAFEIAAKGESIYGDKIFNEMKKYSKSRTDINFISGFVYKFCLAIIHRISKLLS